MPKDSETTGAVSRRDAMKAGGMAAAGMAAVLAAFGSDAAGAATSANAMTVTDFTNFTKLVTACWKSPSLTKSYKSNPQKVLAEYHVHLPQGVPNPVLPPKPSGSFGKSTTTSKAWDKTYVNDLPQWMSQITSASSGGTPINLKGGCFSTFACPLSCFCCITA